VGTLHRLVVLGSAAAIVASAGCEAKDSESGSGDTTGGSVCDAAGQDALAFIESNRQCETHADCKLADGICYQGPEQTCGSVGLAISADDAAWDALHGALQGCECGANACGATAVCTAEGICEAAFGTMDAECAVAEQAVENFLADHRACEVDDDCQYVDKGCYDGPLAACVAISLNVDADLDEWSGLAQALGPCGHDCGGNECGASTRCGADGLCEATFP
jgi:hypothetical protein